MSTAVPVIRALQPEDVPTLARLWSQSPWAERANDLERIAAAAAEGSGEHRGLSSVWRDRVDGVVLYRMVAGAVQTGEIECVTASEYSLAGLLLGIAMAKLRDGGARLIVAEYPGRSEFAEYAELLSGAGIQTQATISDYFAEGVPLVIATRRLDKHTPDVGR